MSYFMNNKMVLVKTIIKGEKKQVLFIYFFIFF